MHSDKRGFLKGSLLALAAGGSGAGAARAEGPTQSNKSDGSSDGMPWSAVAKTRRVVALGLDRPEGSICDQEGNLYVAEMGAGRVSHVGADGKALGFAEDGGTPNGMALGPDGQLYVCNNGGFGKERSRIERITRAGKVTWVVEEVDGKPLTGVNDIVFDRAGRFYCTDPRMPATGTFYTHVCPPGDLIFGGTDGTARRIATAIRFPNGIAISPDGRTLVISESQTGQVHAFDILEPGVLGPERIYASLPSGAPDGLRFDSHGHLLACGFGSGSLHVFAPGGKDLVATIAFDDPKVTNCCFGGDDRRTLYVTETGLGRIVSVQWPFPGLR